MQPEAQRRSYALPQVHERALRPRRGCGTERVADERPQSHGRGVETDARPAEASRLADQRRARVDARPFTQIDCRTLPASLLAKEELSAAPLLLLRPARPPPLASLPRLRDE